MRNRAIACSLKPVTFYTTNATPGVHLLIRDELQEHDGAECQRTRRERCISTQILLSALNPLVLQQACWTVHMLQNEQHSGSNIRGEGCRISTTTAGNVISANRLIQLKTNPVLSESKSLDKSTSIPNANRAKMMHATIVIPRTVTLRSVHTLPKRHSFTKIITSACTHWQSGQMMASYRGPRWDTESMSPGWSVFHTWWCSPGRYECKWAREEWDPGWECHGSWWSRWKCWRASRHFDDTCHKHHLSPSASTPEHSYFTYPWLRWASINVTPPLPSSLLLSILPPPCLTETFTWHVR